MFDKDKTIRELKSQLSELSKRYKSQLDVVIQRLEELKQDSVYILYLPEISPELIRLIKQQIAECRKGTRWTTPNIFFTSVPLEEISIQKLEQLMELKRRVKKK